MGNRPKRAAIVATAALAAVILGVAAGTAVTHESSDPETPDRLKPVSGSARVAATAPSKAGELPYGVMVLDSKTGGSCLAVGLVKNGKLGRVEKGVFIERPQLPAESCGTLPADEIQLGADMRDGELIIHGRAGADVQRVTLRGPSGASEELPLSPDRAFIAVREGTDVTQYPVDVETPAGTKVYSWSGPPKASR